MGMEVRIKKRLNHSFTLDVDFTQERESLGILGASGSGKSMTLKCIAGIETPDEGKITVNGRVLYDSEKRVNLKPRQRRVGYLFQNYALFPKMTVSQNIACGMAERGDRAQEKIRSLVDRFQLEGLEERLPSQISGGQQQRVALARILASEPEVILLDEPFSALDTYLREQMQLQLLEVLKNRQDVIMVTHSRDEVYKLCPRLMVLDGGSILARGGTKQVFEQPMTRQVARLTGCKNISRIRRTGESRVEALDWGITLDTAEPVRDEIKYIGIRAHDLMPVASAREGLPNTFAVRELDRSEDVFEWNIRFMAARGEHLEPVWWKISKYMFQEVPEFLSAPPENLLLLRES